MIRHPESRRPAPLRVLLVEDSKEFAATLLAHLRQGGYDVRMRRVEDATALREALARHSWDLILSDYALPRFDGRAALKICKAQAPDVPFILLSGSIGEDLAVEAMRHGADDYVLKTNTARLLPAIRRSLREAAERRRAKAALQASEAYARRIIESALDMIVAVDTERRITEFNPAAEAAFGYAKAEVLGKHVDLLYADAGESAAVHEAVLRDGRCAREIVNRRKNGETFPSFLRASVMRDAEGAVVGHMGNSRDITEEKRREQELEGAISRLRAILEAAPDGILVTDPSGRAVTFNHRFLELWRMPAEVATASLDARLAHIQDQLKDPRGFREKARALHAEAEGASFDVIELKDGRVFERHSHPQRIAGRSVGRVWIFHDVTERRRMEAEVRQMQKLETLGLLAGGIAHDFNNVLTVIQGRASLLQMERRLDPDLCGAVREIAQAAEMGAKLTTHLLTFGRRRPMQRVALDINDVVKGTAQMLRRLLGEPIALRVECEPSLPAVLADADMLEQVLLNLAVNARDAMPGGGELAITTAAMTFDGISPAGRPSARPGAYVCLSVTDTGCGIAPEHTPRLFEPFFTTKPAGKGTGLGLSTVYGIVQQHGGWIEVESEVRRGAAFRVFLPAQEGEAATKSIPAGEPRAAGGRETILVVEDEGPVRELLRHMLEHLGYTVRLAASGVEALELWQEHREAFDLVMTDVVMPAGLGGLELAERLRSERPALKVILTSGYSAEHLHGRAGAGAKFLKKPFSLQTLAQTVRECLDGAAEQTTGG